MKFKDDILKKINSDFKEKSDEAIKAINNAIKKADYLNNDRIIRCIIFYRKEIWMNCTKTL